MANRFSTAQETRSPPSTWAHPRTPACRSRCWRGPGSICGRLIPAGNASSGPCRRRRRWVVDRRPQRDVGPPPEV